MNQEKPQFTVGGHKSARYAPPEDDAEAVVPGQYDFRRVPGVPRPETIEDLREEVQRLTAGAEMMRTLGYNEGRREASAAMLQMLRAAEHHIRTHAGPVPPPVLRPIQNVLAGAHIAPIP